MHERQAAVDEQLRVAKTAYASSSDLQGLRGQLVHVQNLSETQRQSVAEVLGKLGAIQTEQLEFLSADALQSFQEQMSSVTCEMTKLQTQVVDLQGRALSCQCVPS